MVEHKGSEEAETMSYTRQQRFKDTQDRVRVPVKSERRSELGHGGEGEGQRECLVSELSLCLVASHLLKGCLYFTMAPPRSLFLLLLH